MDEWTEPKKLLINVFTLTSRRLKNNNFIFIIIIIIIMINTTTSWSYIHLKKKKTAMVFCFLCKIWRRRPPFTFQNNEFTQK